MDWFVVVLIVLSIIGSSGKKKKQQQVNRAKQREAAAQAFDEIEKAKPKGKIPASVQREITSFVKELGSDVLDDLPGSIPKAVSALKEVKAGFSPAKPAPKKEMQPRVKSVSKPAAAPEMAPRVVSNPVAPFEPAKRAFAPMTAPDIEGESHAEHQRHINRIREEESNILAAHARAKQVREMDRKALRTAIVVSEVLNKPVSLRLRGLR